MNDFFFHAVRVSINFIRFLAERSGPVLSTEPGVAVDDVAKTHGNTRPAYSSYAGRLTKLSCNFRTRYDPWTRRSRHRYFIGEVSSLITKGVLTCTPEDDTRVVLRRFWTKNIQHMPVVSDDHLVGILILKGPLKLITEEGGTREQRILLDVLKRDAITQVPDRQASVFLRMILSD